MRLTGSERRRLEWVEQATSTLVALAAFMKPRVSLIDGFDAMQGEGPRHGRRLALGTVIAGTDPVAVDAVAASIMGFEPREIAYLRQAEIMGLGTADLSAITIVGDPVSASRRRFRRHSADPLLRLVSSSAAKVNWRTRGRTLDWLHREASSDSFRPTEVTYSRRPGRQSRRECDRCASDSTAAVCPTVAGSAGSPGCCSNALARRLRQSTSSSCSSTALPSPR